jgi:hypothetical protein
MRKWTRMFTVLRSPDSGALSGAVVGRVWKPNGCMGRDSEPS